MWKKQDELEADLLLTVVGTYRFGTYKTIQAAVSERDKKFFRMFSFSSSMTTRLSDTVNMPGWNKKCGTMENYASKLLIEGSTASFTGKLRFLCGNWCILVKSSQMNNILSSYQPPPYWKKSLKNVYEVYIKLILPATEWK